MAGKTRIKDEVDRVRSKMNSSICLKKLFHSLRSTISRRPIRFSRENRADSLRSLGRIKSLASHPAGWSISDSTATDGRTLTSE